MLELSVVFMVLTAFVVFVVYGLFAAAIRRHVIARPRVLIDWMRQDIRRKKRSSLSAPSWQ